LVDVGFNISMWGCTQSLIHIKQFVKTIYQIRQSVKRDYSIGLGQTRRRGDVAGVQVGLQTSDSTREPSTALPKKTQHEWRRVDGKGRYGDLTERGGNRPRVRS